MEPILLDRNGAIATVTLNNPDKLNALHEAMWRGLRDTMRELGSDATLRCVALRGAILLEGGILDAQDAFRKELVNRVVADEDPIHDSRFTTH